MEVVIDDENRWASLDRLFVRNGTFVGSNFVPNDETRTLLSEVLRVLVVGAGGLGCELLKDLALSGFLNLDVIDLDTIDVSNLNRQFLFTYHAFVDVLTLSWLRKEDVGRAKAIVAAEKTMSRIPGANVTPHFCRIEEKPIEFYSDFHLIVLGLDSLEARRYMNSIICSFLEYDEDGNPDPGSVKPIIDGGTEGFKGHSRVIIPGTSPCFECTLWLFPPQIKYPMCTLAETPRTAAHCVEYVHQVLWEKVYGSVGFNTDDPNHMKWMYEQSLERANIYGIQGVTYQLTQGVVKNIIPAIASSNAIIAGICALEAVKVVTGCSTMMDNYMMYTGLDGIYSHTVKYERDLECPICSPGIPISIPSSITLSQFLKELKKHPILGEKVENPSVSFGEKQLFIRGALEAATRPNLAKHMLELVPTSNCILHVNDRKLDCTLRVKLQYEDSC